MPYIFFNYMTDMLIIWLIWLADMLIRLKQWQGQKQDQFRRLLMYNLGKRQQWFRTGCWDGGGKK